MLIPVTCNFLPIKQYKTVVPGLPGSAGKPIPGGNVRIIDENTNKELPPNTFGKICLKLPLPPSCIVTLWGGDQAFFDRYLAESPGYYTFGDAGFINERGYLHVISRIDDVINTAGHRISTGRLEEVIGFHQSVAECAVVGFDNQVKGECPLAFVVLKGENSLQTMSQEESNRL